MDIVNSRNEITAIAFAAAASYSELKAAAEKKEDPIFTEEASKITGYTRETIYNLVHDRAIPFHKTAGRRRLHFYRSELLAWMAKGQPVSTKEKEVVNG